MGKLHGKAIVRAPPFFTPVESAFTGAQGRIVATQGWTQCGGGIVDKHRASVCEDAGLPGQIRKMKGSPMKTFLIAAVFFGIALAATGFVYEEIEYTATEAFSAESARVGHVNPVDGRLGWSPDLE